MWKLLISLQALTLLLGTFCMADEVANKKIAQECMDCHAKDDNMPGLYKQFRKSAHYKSGVTCINCHAAKEGEADAFEHGGSLISLIVSPKDCQECHPKAVAEFGKSQHARARELVTTGIVGYLMNHLAGSMVPAHENDVKYAAGTNGCYMCHGSKIVIGEKGRPSKETWPNTGVARQNPDGSVGNCAACHNKHEFSVAQARSPESCAFCHNSGGGDPQVEAYNTSKHGLAYRNADEMNLSALKWVVGRDYFEAPTCATCHMSATRDMPATHNINDRIGWSDLLQSTNTIAIQEKCGLPDPPSTKYNQPKPDPKHQENMKKVCNACHSKVFSNNFIEQYEMEVGLIKKKWLDPGKELFQLATKLIQAAEKEEYTFFTHSIDFIWFGICNSNAKNAHTGAAMMSPGLTQEGNGGFSDAWSSAYIPALKALIKKYEVSHKEEAEKLKNKLDEIMSKTKN